MYVPCETCRLRFGHEYTSECDAMCEYAQAVLVLKDTKEKLEILSQLTEESSIAKLTYGIKEIISDLAEK